MYTVSPVEQGNHVKVQVQIQSVLNGLAGDAAAAYPGPHFEEMGPRTYRVKSFFLTYQWSLVLHSCKAVSRY